MMDAPPYALLEPTAPDTVVVGSRILVYETIESTNDRALSIGGDGTVVVAERQTAGRGRQGRTWHSPPGLGLWFSVAAAGPADGLGFAAALAVRDALRPYCRVTVKWPNDLLAGGKKVCGILVEQRGGQSAIGIGINVHHKPEDFPEPLRHAAGSLAMTTDRPLDRAQLLRAVLTELDRRLMLIRAGGCESLRREWFEAAGLTGRFVRAGTVEGIVVDVHASGALCVETRAGVRRLVSGDIAWIEET